MTSPESPSQSLRYLQLLRPLVEMAGIISIPAVILGGLGAFMGWRTNSAYLISFGLPTEFYNFTSMNLIITAWMEIGLTLFLGATFILTRVFVIKFLPSLNKQRVFYLFLTVTLLALAGTGLVVSRVFFIRGLTNYFLWLVSYGIIAYLCLVWFIIGDYLYHQGNSWYVNSRIYKLHSLFSTLFSLRYALVLLLVAFIFYYLFTSAGIRGTYFASRDRSAASHLTVVDLVSNTPIEILEFTESSRSDQDSYIYKNFRRIAQNDQYIALFRLEDVDPQTDSVDVYIVPLENIEIIMIHQWYDTRNYYSEYPEVTPTSTISPLSPP